MRFDICNFLHALIRL